MCVDRVPADVFRPAPLHAVACNVVVVWCGGVRLKSKSAATESVIRTHESHNVHDIFD